MSIYFHRYFDDNLPEDDVAYADFDAPLDGFNPKDSSATAIVASALFDIFELTGKTTSDAFQIRSTNQL